jgi:hypothetical protein
MGATIGIGTRSLKARSVIMGRCRWLVIGAVLAGLALVPASASAATKPPLTIGMTFSAYEFDHNIASLPAYGRELNMELATAYATIFHMQPNGEITSDIGTTYQYFNTKKPRTRTLSSRSGMTSSSPTGRRSRRLQSSGGSVTCTLSTRRRAWGSRRFWG